MQLCSNYLVKNIFVHRLIGWLVLLLACIFSIRLSVGLSVAWLTVCFLVQSCSRVVVQSCSRVVVQSCSRVVVQSCSRVVVQSCGRASCSRVVVRSCSRVVIHMLTCLLSCLFSSPVYFITAINSLMKEVDKHLLDPDLIAVSNHLFRQIYSYFIPEFFLYYLQSSSSFHHQLKQLIKVYNFKVQFWNLTNWLT